NIMKLHKLSLFGAVVGALIFMAALAPRANAALIVYFNFEDATTGGAPDFVADTTPTNPGGGQQNSTITTNYTAGDFESAAALAIASTNRTAADIDTTANQALSLFRSTSNNGKYIQFTVDSTFLQDLSLSFSFDNNGHV